MVLSRSYGLALEGLFMTNVLVLNSSALGAASVSQATRARCRVEAAGNRRIAQHRDARHRGQSVAASDRRPRRSIGRGTPANDAQAKAQALSNELIAELQAADILILGAPMYNFGIPSTLKAWFDHVLRRGVTFRYGRRAMWGF